MTIHEMLGDVGLGQGTISRLDLSDLQCILIYIPNYYFFFAHLQYVNYRYFAIVC